MAKVSPIIVFIPLLLGAFLKLCCMEAPANHTVPQEKLSDDILNDIEEQLLLNCGLMAVCSKEVPTVSSFTCSWALILIFVIHVNIITRPSIWL